MSRRSRSLLACGVVCEVTKYVLKVSGMQDRWLFECRGRGSFVVEMSWERTDGWDRGLWSC